MGRAKGIPNKDKQALRERLERLGYQDPVEALAELAKTAKESGELVLAKDCFKEVAKYIHPTLKSIETRIDVPDGLEVRTINRNIVEP